MTTYDVQYFFGQFNWCIWSVKFSVFHKNVSILFLLQRVLATNLFGLRYVIQSMQWYAKFKALNYTSRILVHFKLSKLFLEEKREIEEKD